MDTLKRVVHLMATCLGLAVIVIGLVYAIDVFRLILTMLNSPSALADPVRELAASFGGSAFDVKLPDRTVPLANLIALVVYCCGVLAGAFLTMALMQTGAKIVSLTAGDRTAIKQMLQSAFGSRMQPKGTPEDNRRQPRE
ncbi:hypothetical protein [Desulfobulbus elongatus]|uniref:hypothetical protein n=1 Tax=Desulfobulbus elongatus TaxID=53332 RepID=UPI001FE1D89A|nr:hypothetical protein [Desulfobulbus elongatus]